VRVAPLSRPFYYYRPYRPGLSLGFYYGYPWGWGSLAFGYPYFGYSPYYGYPYYGAYAYPGGYATAYPGYGVRAYGGVRIDVPQRPDETFDALIAGRKTMLVNEVLIDRLGVALQTHLLFDPFPIWLTGGSGEVEGADRRSA